MKPIIVAPLVALALAGGGAGAYFWVTAAGTAEEAPPSAQQPTATPTPTAAPQPTPAPSLLPQPTPAPVPADWLSYTDPGTGVTLRYPPDWVVEKIETSGYPELGVPAQYRVDIYAPVPNATSVPTSEGEGFWSPRTAQVSIWSGEDPKFLEWWKCDHPATKLVVSGLSTDLCVYLQGVNPHPQGGMTAAEAAYMFYTLHSARGDRYIGIILYAVPNSAADEEMAKRIVTGALVDNP